MYQKKSDGRHFPFSEFETTAEFFPEKNYLCQAGFERSPLGRREEGGRKSNGPYFADAARKNMVLEYISRPSYPSLIYFSHGVRYDIAFKVASREGF